MEQCEGICVVYALVESGVRPTSTAQVRAMDGRDCEFSRIRPPFLGHYGELHQADVSLILNENDGSQFDLVQRCDAVRHIRNSVR